MTQSSEHEGVTQYVRLKSKPGILRVAEGARRKSMPDNLRVKWAGDAVLAECFGQFSLNLL